MRARNVAPVALNVRVSPALRRSFDIAVARRGLTIQQAVDEALRHWIAAEVAAPKKHMGEPPVIRSKNPGTRIVTPEMIDEALFG